MDKKDKTEAETKLAVIEKLIERYENDVEVRPAMIIDLIAGVVRS